VRTAGPLSVHQHGNRNACTGPWQSEARWLGWLLMMARADDPLAHP